MINSIDIYETLLTKLNELRTKYHEIKIKFNEYTDMKVIQVDLTNFCTSDFTIIFGIDEISFYRNGEFIVNGSLFWCGYEVVEIIINMINNICDDLYESE